MANVAAVQWDREKASSRAKQQDELLREYLLHHLYPYSPFYRRRFDGAGVVPKNVSTAADLAKLEPTSWNEVAAEPGAFVLRPTERAIARFGERRLVMAIAKAKLRGRVSQLNRDLIDPSYKPVHWQLAGQVPIGYSGEDLERLGEAGRRLFHLADVGREDVLATVVAPGPHLSYWQLVDGARHAGLSAAHLGPTPRLEQLEAFAPTVLAGSPEELRRVLESVASKRERLPGLRTVLAVGALVEDDERDVLRKLGRSVGEEDVDVVAAWAPPGVRALWAECRGGRALHTYPDLELLEMLPDGEVAWSSLAWHGTTFLRLRTGVRFAAIDDTPCETCGRLGPRLRLTATPPRPAPPPLRAPVPVSDLAGADVAGAGAEVAAPVPVEPPLEPVGTSLAVLDTHPGVAAWQAEYRRVDGRDELIIFVAPAGVDRLGPLFRELDATLKATQYVVMRPEQVSERVVRNGAVLDLR